VTTEYDRAEERENQSESSAQRKTATMALQSIELEHLPPRFTIHVALYRDVKNASFLHQQLLVGNTDFEYALIDASVVS
jgi:hypothetical protein